MHSAGNGGKQFPQEEHQMAKYYCKVCGIEFDVEDGEEPVCPVCGAEGDDVEKVEE